MVQRRIILVDFYWTRDKDPRIPLGHASILTALKSAPELEVRSLVVAVNAPHLDAQGIVQCILEEARGRVDAEVDVAFGAYVWGEALLQEVLSSLRAAGFQGRIVLGGPQISYSGAGLESLYPQADAFIRGYGEAALKAFALGPEKSDIQGVHWAGTKDLRMQASVDLEALPSPWLSGAIPLQQQRFIRWETQRGCAFKCAFCQHREPGERLPKRSLDLERIKAEIDLFCDMDVREIAVLDPIFNMAPHAVAVLERFVARGFKGKLSLQCRAEVITEAFLDAAAQLDVCLEFGLQTTQKEEWKVIKRQNDLLKVDKVLTAVRERGIAHEVSLIFGLPRQTLASFEASIAWCLERKVPVIKAFPLMLLRGTKLEQERANWDLRDSGGEMPTVIASSTFTSEEWEAMAQLSEALKLTEGAHPPDLEALKEVARELTPNWLRWRPGPKKDAA